jgi:molybdopterin synthase sulfur carrier subunit
VAADIRVTVLYFARLREALGCDSERVTLPADAQTLSALRERLRSRGGAWETELAPSRPVRVALNQDMVSADVRLGDGDEVAFFPPVTGG